MEKYMHNCKKKKKRERQNILTYILPEFRSYFGLSLATPALLGFYNLCVRYSTEN